MIRNPELYPIGVLERKILIYRNSRFFSLFFYNIKSHIRGFFCLWDDVKKVLFIEPFVEIWNKEKKEWVEKG